MQRQTICLRTHTLAKVVQIAEYLFECKCITWPKKVTFALGVIIILLNTPFSPNLNPLIQFGILSLNCLRSEGIVGSVVGVSNNWRICVNGRIDGPIKVKKQITN